ncbi:MAG: tetratricopeptide repeat protein [Elusimicrobiota bacterium]
MARRVHPAAGWLCASAVFLAAAQGFSALRSEPHLPVFERPVLEEHALMDVSLVLAGLRRFGGDLAFIQMLQYYSSAQVHDEGPDGHEKKEYHLNLGSEAAADLHPHVRLDNYPRLFSHFTRIVSLDPYFQYAYLFGGGALAFNLNRNDEAVALLEKGMQMDPANWQLRLYAGAVAFRKADQMEKVIALLEDAIQHPDCPSMVENILANIYRKRGDIRRAAEVYLHMLETSRDESYRSTARQKLKELQDKHGLHFHHS